MQIENELKLNFDDVLIKPKTSTIKTNKEIILKRTFIFPHSGMKWKGVPIIATNIDTVATLDAANVLEKYKMMSWVHRSVDREAIKDYNLNYTIPSISEEDDEDLWDFPMLRIDSVNGYNKNFIDFVKRIREYNTNTTIFAGNVCTPEITEELILAGADCVVIGTNFGGQRNARIKAGVGYPQLSAVIECADAAHGHGAYIASCGGCRTPADIAKTFAAGADFVGLDYMFVAHNENTDAEKVIFKNEVAYCEIYNDMLDIDINKYCDIIKNNEINHIRMRGPLKNTIQDILESLSLACTYVGASKLSELSDNCTFIRVN